MSTIIRHWALFLTASLIPVLLSCRNVPRPEHGKQVPSFPDATLQVYDCLEQWAIPVRVGDDAAQLYLADTTVYLPRSRSASGSRYTTNSGDFMFWVKGERAIVEANDRSYGYCFSVPDEIPWQRARLNGAILRAGGESPVWNLEKYHERTQLTIDSLTYTLPASPDLAVSHPDAQSSVYRFRLDTGTATLTLLAQPCRSDLRRRLPFTAELNFEGSTYHGCATRYEQR